MKLRIHQAVDCAPVGFSGRESATIELLPDNRYGEPNGDPKAEGEALADLLFDRLSGATLDAMVAQLRARYDALPLIRSPFETGEML